MLSHKMINKSVRDGARWTKTEEREMIYRRRHAGMTFHEIALDHQRSVDAIKLRFEKLVVEHSEGEDGVSEALLWFNLSEK